MKKKAIISAVACVAVAGVMCVGFAACGGGIDPEKLKSEKLTAGQWIDAFDADLFRNVKIEKTVEDRTEGGGAETSTKQTETVTIAGDRAHYKKVSEMNLLGASTKTETEQYETYNAEGSDGSLTVYVKGLDGAWSEEPSPYLVYAAYKAPYEYTALADKYGDFTYSEEDKGYVATDSTAGTLAAKTVYKFKDAKLAAIWSKQEAEVGSLKTAHIFSVTFAYGGQKVNIPKETGYVDDGNYDDGNGDNDDNSEGGGSDVSMPSSGGTVTEEEWGEAFDSIWLCNCTVTVTLIEGDETKTQIIYFSGTDEASGEGEVFIDCSYTGKTFLNENVFGGISSAYNEFTYDGAYGAYGYRTATKGGTLEATVRFSQKRLVFYECVFVSGEERTQTTVLVRDYGSTTVPGRDIAYN